MRRASFAIEDLLGYSNSCGSTQQKGPSSATDQLFGGFNFDWNCKKRLVVETNWRIVENLGVLRAADARWSTSRLAG
jgi:hypothetical protein